MAKINVLIVHSADDKELKDDLLVHLSSQKEDGKASFWDRDSIQAGTEETKAIASELDKAHIILLLLSADFFNTEYCVGIEKEAFALEKTNNVTVVPIMLRHFDLGAKYDSRTTIPRRNQPLTSKHWHSEDEALKYVAEIIGDIIEARISERKSPHLKPPSIFRKIVRKFKRPAGILMYFILLLLGFSLLLTPKYNLPAEIELVVNQVDFQLIENRGNGLWSKSIFAKKAKIKNFSSAVIPGKSIRFQHNPEQLMDIPESRIKINRLSRSVEPYLYLFDVYLSEWHISDSSQIQIRMAEDKSLFIAVDKGPSKGTFHFSDSLEFYTESSVLKSGNAEYKNDLEAMIYSSVGRVNFESDDLYHSISLDSLKESIDATNLHVTMLQFEKDLRNEKGTPLSSILSGKIRVNEFDPIVISSPETFLLKLESSEPLKIQKINVLDNSIELLIIGDNVKDIQKGTSLTTMESQMPTILEWLTTKYKLGLLAGLIALLSPFIFFGITLFKKKASKY